MILENESTLTVSALTTFMCSRKPGSMALVVVDSMRQVEANYLFGPGRILTRLNDVPGRHVYRKSHSEVSLQNGSKVVFLAICNEKDVERLNGLEPHMIAIDHGAMLPNIALRAVKLRDRSGFTLNDLKALNTDRVRVQ